MGVEWSEWDSCPYEKDPGELSYPFPLCEDRARRPLSMNHKVSSQRRRICWCRKTWVSRAVRSVKSLSLHYFCIATWMNQESLLETMVLERTLEKWAVFTRQELGKETEYLDVNYLGISGSWKTMAQILEGYASFKGKKSSWKAFWMRKYEIWCRVWNEHSEENLENE